MQTRELCSGSVLQERAAGASSLVCTDLKTMNDLVPEYLQSLFSQRHSAYNLRNSEGRLTMSKPSTNYLKRSFSYSGAMLWNNFPKNLKNAAR